MATFSRIIRDGSTLTEDIDDQSCHMLEYYIKCDDIDDSAKGEMRRVLKERRTSIPFNRQEARAGGLSIRAANCIEKYGIDGLLKSDLRGFRGVGDRTQKELRDYLSRFQAAAPSRPSGLRDHFAGLAMQSLLLRGWVGDRCSYDPCPYAEDADPESSEIGPDSLAASAYIVADAMLAEREKGGAT